MIDSIRKEDCTGCKMCGDICPCNAIFYTTEKDGFWYPQVNQDKCVKCGLCIEKCPSLNPVTNDNFFPITYSLWSNDDHIRITSTSGGAFWEFADWIISQGGVVAGAKYGDDWRSAEHFIASNKDDLEFLKGSKYFQSDTNGIYKKIKEHLETKKLVLFCGTPCQNAALQSFLGKDYDNLFYMDFICRSINSPKAFKAYIDELEEKFGSKVIEVHLKNKDNGWQSLASQVRFENGQQSLRDKDNDYWVRGFIYNDLYTRDSCFHCKYKVIPRISADLTIGDFWGITNQSEENMFKGISVLLINSKKGITLFEKVKERFTYSEHDFDEVFSGNPALKINPKETNKKEQFFNLLNSGREFSAAVNECIKESYAIRIRKRIKNVLRKIKKAYILFYKEEISIAKFFYYNYICRHIERKGNGKIIPHKNAILNFDPGSKIILNGKDLEIGFNKLRGSKSETHVRLNNNAIWNCKNGGLLFYDTVLEIKKNAYFESGFFSANGGSVIIVHKKIEFGEDVMIGRNVIIYDSDFHSIYNKNGEAVNYPKPVRIEDHVWLTTNIMVQKGVTIGRNSLIAAYTVINKDVPPHSIIGGKSNGEIIKDWVSWGRKICPLDNMK